MNHQARHGRRNATVVISGRKNIKHLFRLPTQLNTHCADCDYGFLVALLCGVHSVRMSRRSPAAKMIDGETLLWTPHRRHDCTLLQRLNEPPPLPTGSFWLPTSRHTRVAVRKDSTHSADKKKKQTTKHSNKTVNQTNKQKKQTKQKEMQKLVCFATLLAAASAQVFQPNLVPTLFAGSGTGMAACGDSVPTTRASIGNCMRWNTASMKFTANEDLAECKAKGDKATTWTMDYWTGSTDCTGESERTRVILIQGQCYHFGEFSVSFQTTLGAVEACEMAGMQAKLYGQEVILTEYNNGECEGSAASVETVPVFVQSTAPAPVGASKCENVCDGFCCRRASDDCVLAPGSYKQMMTCFRGRSVVSLEEFSDNACAVQESSIGFVAGQCNKASDTMSMHALISPSMAVVGAVCDYTPAEGVLFTGGVSSVVLAVVTSATFTNEIAHGGDVLDTVGSPAGTPALSLLVATAALCAMML
ncbi:hypothetical protein DIPPA_23580 [Diplonema papillatum]|nr:hypothetical protein DIPPA_23580 [Diplonema papillatum]